MYIALGVLLLCIAAVPVRAHQRARAAEHDFPPVGQIVTVGKTEVHIKIVGQGPDIVMIHGANGNLRDYTLTMADRLKDRYRVTLIDRPGLGYTDRLNGRFGPGESPVEQAKLLQKAVAQVGVTRPIVFGHSFGGAVALAWALEAPDDTAALVLNGSVAMPWPGGLGAFYRLVGTPIGGALAVPVISALVPQTRVSKAVDSTFAPQDPPTEYETHFGTGLTLRPNTMRANTRQVNELRPHIVAMQKRYNSLKLPIEMIHGTADTIVPPTIHAIPFSEAQETANLTLLEGIGHMPHHTNPDDVIAAIDRAAARANG